MIGSLASLLRGQFRFLEQVFADEGAIFELKLGPLTALVVGDAEAADEVLITRADRYDKGGEFWDSARELLGHGIGASEGELWRRQHKLMLPSFRRAAISGYRGMIDETVSSALDAVKVDAPIEFDQWSNDLLSVLTVRILLGTNLPLEQIREVRESMSALFATVLPEMVLRKLPRWLPRPGRGRLAAARERVDNALMAVIADKRERGPGEDLLSMLVNATDEAGAMSDEQLRDEAIFIYTAGFETTGASLAWTTLLLAQHPELLAALREELDGDGDDKPLLRACIQEGLRLYPPGVMVPRRAVADDVLGGFRVKAGTLVLVYSWLIHRDPRWWPSPARFDPARFMDAEAARARPRLAWSPFGAGQRICLGKGLALLELERALTQLLTRFTPVVVDDGAPPQPRMSTTLKSDKPIRLMLRRRA